MQDDSGAQVMFSVRNGPASLYKLKWDTQNFIELHEWCIHFPDGSGNPDAEDLALTDISSDNAIYACTERDDDGDAKDISKLSILRYSLVNDDTTGECISASHEWDLTSVMPPCDPNKGFEGLTWLPDSVLVSQSFIDTSTDEPYEPSRYPDHGGGVFFVSLEDAAHIYGVVVNYSNVTDFSVVVDFQGKMHHLLLVCL